MVSFPFSLNKEQNLVPFQKPKKQTFLKAKNLGGLVFMKKKQYYLNPDLNTPIPVVVVVLPHYKSGIIPDMEVAGLS